MKFKLVILVLVASLTYQKGYSQWYKSKFVIGSFADPRVSRDNNRAKDSVSFALAKGASINLLSGPQFYNGGQDFSLMDKTLDLASKNNMHVMLIDSKLSVTNANFSTADAQKIISHFKNIDPKRRAAIGGYNFGGEFPLDKSAQVKKWQGYFKSNDPEKVAFVYLLPNYGFPTRAAYETYLNTYLNDKIANNKSEVVAYDYYPFTNSAILTSYFYNISIIKKKAGNRPVWYYIQSTTKKTAPDITDYQMKFMAYCPLAYGSKGAIYYTYGSIPDNYGLNYHDALINPYGNVTKKYYTAKTINYYLSYVAGPIIMANSCIGTYHVSRKPTNENIPSINILSKRNKYVSSIDNENVLVGIFKNSNSSKYYLMLINKSESDIANVKISVPGSKSVNAFPGSESYHGSMKMTALATTVDNGGNSKASTFAIDKIPGGEMTVVEIK